MLEWNFKGEKKGERESEIFKMILEGVLNSRCRE